MLARKWIVGAAALCVSGLGASLALSQDKPKDKPKEPKPAAKADNAKPQEGQPEMSEEMMAWIKAATPGPQHKLLDGMVGSWDCKVRTWMDPSMTEPMETAGTSESKWILGGRFVETVFKGEMMGGPFEGRGYDAYDNVTEKFTGVWMDTSGTGIFMQTGTYDAAKKEFTFTGEMVDAHTKKTTPTKSVVKVLTDDSHVFSMFAKPDPAGDWVKHLEITYARAKSSAKAGE